MTERIHLGGFTNTTIHRESDGTVIVEEKQDCQSILDANARKRNERFSGASPDGFVQEAFDIPMVLVHRWQLECGHRMYSKEHMEYMNQRLKLPEFSYLVSAPKVRDPHIIIKGAR